MSGCEGRQLAPQPAMAGAIQSVHGDATITSTIALKDIHFPQVRRTNSPAATRRSSPSGIANSKRHVTRERCDGEAHAIIETPGRRIGPCWRATRAPRQVQWQGSRTTFRPRPPQPCFWHNAKNAIQETLPLVHFNLLTQTARNSTFG